MVHAINNIDAVTNKICKTNVNVFIVWFYLYDNLEKIKSAYNQSNKWYQ